MLKYYFKIAFRDIFRRKLYSLVIIFSLALAFTCTNYIVAFLVNELTVDGFHEKKDRIFRLQADDPWVEGGRMDYIRENAPEIIARTYPEVEDFCVALGLNEQKIMTGKQQWFDPYHILAVSPSFFSMFTYHFIEGDPHTALLHKQNMVITKPLADKLFGNEGAYGKNLTVFLSNDTITYTVAGVIKDMSHRSHRKADMIVSLEGHEYPGSRAYLLLKPGADRERLEQKFSADRDKIPVIHDGTPGTHYLQALQDIYFDKGNKPTGENQRDPRYLRIAALAGLLIMIISFLNYLNLVAFRLAENERNVELFRIMGGKARHVSLMLLTEFFLLIFLAYDISLPATRLILPYFNRLTDSTFAVSSLFSPAALLSSLAIMAFITLISWLFIRNHIRSQKLHEMLSFSVTPVTRKRRIPFLVVIQFAIAVVFITAGITIARQMDYIRRCDIGLDREVIEIRIPRPYKAKATAFKNDVLQQDVVRAASVCSASPVLERAMVLLHYEEDGESKTYSPSIFFGDEDYADVLGLRLIEGRFFDSHDKGKQRCVVNRSMTRHFDMENPVGRKLPGSEDVIIGVVEDFHYQSLEHNITPGYLAFSENGGNILVKLKEDRYAEGLNRLEHIWQAYFPDYPFEFQTLGEQFDNFHAASQRFFRFITAFSVIALLITSVGLFAITLYSTRIRTKEIGIRKTNGAGAFRVMAGLVTGILKWVLLAMFIAFPVAWYLMDRWLQQFAFRLDLSWWIMAATACLTLLIALCTVGWQSYLAASRNPVEALRYE